MFINNEPENNKSITSPTSPEYEFSKGNTQALQVPFTTELYASAKLDKATNCCESKSFLL